MTQWRRIFWIGGLFTGAILLLLGGLLLRWARTPATDPALATFAAAGKVQAVQFSPDGHYLLSLESDATIWVRSIPEGQVVRTMSGHAEVVQSLAVSPVGQLAASGGADGTVRLWDYVEGHLLATFPVPAAAVPDVAFSSDGTMLAAAIGNPFDEHVTGFVQIWRVADRTAWQAVAYQDPPVRQIAFDGSGTNLITNDATNPIRVWQIEGGQLVRSINTTEDYNLMMNVHAQTQMIVLDSFDISLWSVIDGQSLGKLGRQPGQLWSLAVSRDGQLVASGSGSPGYREGNPVQDWSIRIWRVADHTLIKTIQAHGAEIKALAFSPTESLLASGSDDQMIKLWALKP
jgi:WD40 repeat protein